MTTFTQSAANGFNWLDERGRGAWFLTIFVGFLAFPLLGLALLITFFMRGNKMFACNSHRKARRYNRNSSGNSAFDAYRDATIKRLEDEQEAFHAYLEKLRQARDKTEFDGFMEDYKDTAANGDDTPATA